MFASNLSRAYSFCCVLFLCIVTNVFGQATVSVIDSLKQQTTALKDTLLVEAYSEISWEYKNSNTDSAMFYARKALAFSRKINHNKAIANSYNLVGSNFEGISELDSALYYYEKSLDIKYQINDSIGIANSYNNIGIVNDEKGNYLEALNNYFNALKVYEKNHMFSDKVPMTYVNIGIVYKKQKKYEKVLEYYQKALALYESGNHEIGIVITKGNIGSVLLKLERAKEAIVYSEEAKKMYASLGYTKYVPYMEVQIAKAKDILQQFTAARELYQKAIDQFKEDNNTFEWVDTQIALANNYYHTKSYVAAEELAEKALKTIRNKAFNELELKALKVLSKAQFETGKYKKAYTNASAYTLQKDSVFEFEKTRAIFELETKYDTEKKERELLQVKAEKATTELHLSNQRLITYGLIGGLAILFLLGLSVFQRNKQKHQIVLAHQKEENLQLVIAAEEKERTRIARELHDGIVQQIGVTILKSRNIFDKLGISNKPESEEMLQVLEASSAELRSISHQMMPRALEEKGLITALEDLFVDSLKSSKIKYSFEHQNIDQRLSKKIEVTLYRITQELVNNILKHSEASEVNIQLFQTESAILFMVEDNGIGFNASEKEGVGLKNIQSRIHLIKGTVNFASENTSTLTTIKIPL